MFKIDEKVVCIHDFIAREDTQLGVIRPKKGEMYTIRSMESHEGEIYLRFKEIKNPVLGYLNGKAEAQFWDERFRKLDYDFVEEVMANIKEEVVYENR